MNFIPVVVFKLAVGSVFILFVSLYSLFGIETNRSLLCKYIVILSFCKIFCAFFMIRAFFAESASRGFWLLMFDDSSAAAAVADFCILGHVGNLAGEMACLSRFLLDAAFWEGRLFIII